MLTQLSLNKLNEYVPSIEFESFLFEGGQKKVFKGKLNGKNVVVKFVPINSKEEFQRINREISCMNQIESKNLVKFIKCDNIKVDRQNIVVLIEDYIDGKTLRNVILNNPSLELSFKLLRTLLELLIKFEEKKIIHRDIKPENIMVSNGNHITLLDFGVAKILNDVSITNSKSPWAPGTFQYCAPEQLHNRKLMQDIRTDIYSCGIVFFETATGSLPFEQDEFGNLETSILEGKRKSLKGYFSDHPKINEIERFFVRMTNSQPCERFRKPCFALDELKKIMGENDHEK